MSLFATTFFVLTLSALGFSCPDGWVHFGSSCYLHIWDAVTWPEAQTICSLMNSCLVEIESAEENQFIVTRMAILHVPKVWIGINDFAHEGRFVMTSSGRPIKYARWHAGEPNNGGHQNCGGMYRDGTWDDDYCDQSFKYPNLRPRHTFFCEKSFNPKSSTFLRKKYKQKLEKFEDTCNLIRYLGDTMPAQYPDPHHDSHAEMVTKLDMFMALKDIEPTTNWIV